MIKDREKRMREFLTKITMTFREDFPEIKGATTREEYAEGVSVHLSVIEAWATATILATTCALYKISDGSFNMITKAEELLQLYIDDLRRQMGKVTETEMRKVVEEL
jgi:hypothetical protein